MRFIINWLHSRIIGLMLISFVAGAIFSLSLSPIHYWWIALISPAILYSCLYKKTSKQAFWLGWSYGFGLWFVGAFWLYTSIHLFGGLSPIVSTLLVAIMALIMGLFTAVQCWLYRKYLPESPFTFAPVWVIFEWLKTWLFTGFPWLFVGYAFTERFLDAYAPLFGVLAVSFVAVFIATSFVELFKKRWKWLIPSAGFIVIAAILQNITFVSIKDEKPLTVSLIQGNIAQNLKWDPQQFINTLNVYTNLSEAEWGRDLIVWPESAIANYQVAVLDFLNALSEKAKSKSSAWITGIFYLDEHTQESYNSVLALGDSNGVYHKQRLVPFGEYIPLAGLLYWVLPEMQKDVANGGLTIGKAQLPLLIKDQGLATAICYEVAYPDITRNNAQQSNFLLTVSNDAWFVGTNGPWQHLQMVQMRAKENGRWFIRATNTGVTAIINEQGKIVKRLEQDVEGVLRGDIPMMEGRTWYNRFGDYPIIIFSLVLIFIGRYLRR